MPFWSLNTTIYPNLQLLIHLANSIRIIYEILLYPLSDILQLILIYQPHQDILIWIWQIHILWWCLSLLKRVFTVFSEGWEFCGANKMFVYHFDYLEYLFFSLAYPVFLHITKFLKVISKTFVINIPSMIGLFMCFFILEFRLLGLWLWLQ